jgi:hypothetical protein
MVSVVVLPVVVLAGVEGAAGNSGAARQPKTKRRLPSAKSKRGSVTRSRKDETYISELACAHQQSRENCVRRTLRIIDENQASTKRLSPP